MKTIFFAGLVALSLFLVACGPNLPPEPGAPGTVAGGALAGRVVSPGEIVNSADYTNDGHFQLVDENAVPFSGPNPVCLANDNNELNVFAVISLEDLSHSIGYFQSVNAEGSWSGWQSFDFPGVKVGSTNWIRGPVTSGLLTINVASDAVAYLFAAYGCSHIPDTDNWGDCHRGKFLAAGCVIPPAEETLPEVVCPEGQELVEGSGCLPSEPEAPPSDGTPAE